MIQLTFHKAFVSFHSISIDSICHVSSLLILLLIQVSEHFSAFHEVLTVSIFICLKFPFASYIIWIHNFYP